MSTQTPRIASGSPLKGTGELEMVSWKLDSNSDWANFRASRLARHYTQNKIFSQLQFTKSSNDKSQNWFFRIYISLSLCVLQIDFKLSNDSYRKLRVDTSTGTFHFKTKTVTMRFSSGARTVAHSCVYRFMHETKFSQQG